MSGHPVDPIWYPLAVRKLWERLATHAGVNLREHQLGADEELSTEQRAKYAELDERLGKLREDAAERIWNLVWMGQLKAWVADGENWKRPTPQVVRQQLTQPNDEPVQLYVDGEELSQLAPDSYSIGQPRGQASTKAKTRGSVSRGRPKGSGAYPDGPSLDRMSELMRSGVVTSVRKAAEAVADDAPQGNSRSSTVIRLCQKFTAQRRGQ